MKLSQKKPVLLLAAAVALALLVLAAYFLFMRKGAAPTGADVFKQYYAEKAQTDTENDYSRMELSALDAMASSTMGTVVDTDEFSVEVLGAIVSGNTAEILLRVTAKQVDTVLNGGATKPLGPCGFGDEVITLMYDTQAEQLSHGYTYSDEDGSLAPNQFKLHYWIVGRENFQKERYAVGLTDFYYYDAGGTKHSYSGNWRFDVAFDPPADSGRSISIEREVTIGETAFTLRELYVTPLACTIHLRCEEDGEYTEENSQKIYQDSQKIYHAFADESRRCTLTLTDGTVWDGTHFTASPGGGGGDYKLILEFNGPMAVEELASLSVFGDDYALQ